MCAVAYEFVCVCVRVCVLLLTFARLHQHRVCALSPTAQRDFLDSLKKVNPSVGKADLERYRLWMDEFGST